VNLNIDISVPPRELYKTTLAGHTQIGRVFSRDFQCISAKTPKIDKILGNWQ
jgi:hypothetical protein